MSKFLASAGFPTGVENMGEALQNLVGSGLESIYGGNMEGA